MALSESRLISIVAPAGFGKTTVARTIADDHGGGTVCDAAGASDVRAFAGRMIRAIAPLAPEREDALTSDLYLNLQPGVSDAQLAGFVLDAWSSLDDARPCIFDNLESIAGDPESLDLLVRLINAGRQRLLILCARPPFALLNSRLIPPNAHLRLRIDDLAFTRDEIAAVFDQVASDAQLSAILAITQGWPVAVLLLRQLARLGQLDRALDATNGSAFDDLRDYLVNEVLGSIDGAAHELLVALVATAAAGPDATRRATDGAATSEALYDLAQRLPLVVPASDGTWSVHPLLASVVERTSGPAVERLRLRAAASYRADGRLCEAARLFLDGGDTAAAAACLEAVAGPYIENNAIVVLENLVERMPASTLAAYPRLWALLCWVRRGVVSLDVLVAEGMALRERLRDDPQSVDAKQVAALLIILGTHLALHEFVEDLLAGYTLDEFDLSPGNVALLIAATFRNALLGLTRGAMERYHRLMPLVRNDLLCAYFIVRTEVVVSTMSGRFEDALVGQLRALRHAKSSGRSTLIAGMQHQQSFVAWLAGDDAATEVYMDEIRRMGGSAGIAAYAALADAWDTGRTSGIAALRPRRRAYSLLMLAGKAPAGERRRALLDDAAAASSIARDRWSGLLVTVARAMDDPPRRAALLAEAAAIALDVGQPGLEASIASLRAGGDGAPTLHVFARRFDGSTQRGAAPPEVCVNVLSRTVWRGDHQLPVSNRVLSLLTALGVLERVSRDDLLDLLWGHDTLESGTNALKMLISRARRQLGDPSLIVAAGGWYALRDDVRVDFHRIRRLLGSLAPHDPITDAQRDALREAYEEFRPAWRSKESIPSIEAAIAGARHQVVERLARDALDRGEIAYAFAMADELRRHDHDDESAYELLIRAYVRAGNSASALREYRHYSDHLMHDLGVEPSFSLDDLLQEARN